MFKRNSIKILLALIFLISIAVRLINLNGYPPSLNWDEASHGYNAYSVLTTGKDEWGKSFPLIFKAFGDYKLPVYIYSSVIPIAVFGLNSFATRFVSVLAGLLAIFGIYLLTKQLFPGKKISLLGTDISLAQLSSIFLLLLPWHFFISRPALEANLALTLTIFGFYFLIKSKQNPVSLIFSALLLGLSLHTYNSARVFILPMLAASIFILKIKPKINLISLSSIVIFFIFGLLVVTQTFNGEGTARYDKVKILSENTVFQIGERRATSSLPAPLPKLLFNRPVYFVTTLAKNYTSYFLPAFFTQSNAPQWQFAIPNTNMITFPIMILFYLGVIFVLLNLKGDKTLQFLLAWIIFSPLAASLTADPPQAIRPVFMIPSIILVSVYALWKLFSKIKFSSTIIVLLTFICFCLYLNKYFTSYPQIYSESWQYGTKEIMDYAKQNENKYDHVFITKKYGEPHIFYQFFNKLDPKLLQDKNVTTRFYQSEWYWTDKIGKYYFLNEKDIPGSIVDNLTLESKKVVSTKNSLLITSPNHIPENSTFIKTVNFLDGSPAYIIVSIP